MIRSWQKTRLNHICVGDGKVVLQGGLGSCGLIGSRGGRESLQRVANRMHLHVPLVQANMSRLV